MPKPVADNMVTKDSAAMLHAAAVKKARADYSALMKDHIERVAQRPQPPSMLQWWRRREVQSRC